MSQTGEVFDTVRSLERWEEDWMEIVRVLEPVPSAAGQARHSLVSLSRTVSPEQLDELRLVVSELVTNSVLHAGLGERDSITLSVEVLSESVRVEVIDGGHGFDEASELPLRGHGWGLPIVDQLADRWGTERTSETKVWAEFALRPKGGHERTRRNPAPTD